jgi:hypothetical protein
MFPEQPTKELEQLFIGQKTRSSESLRFGFPIEIWINDPLKRIVSPNPHVWGIVYAAAPQLR